MHLVLRRLHLVDSLLMLAQYFLHHFHSGLRIRYFILSVTHARLFDFWNEVVCIQGVVYEVAISGEFAMLRSSLLLIGTYLNLLIVFIDFYDVLS